MQFLVSDYMATGEGITIMILITMAYPRSQDYEESESKLNPDGSFHFVMPKLREGITPEIIAKREFAEHFGHYFAKGAESISKEEFKKKFAKHIPETVLRTIDDGDMGNFSYHSKFHVNYS